MDGYRHSFMNYAGVSAAIPGIVRELGLASEATGFSLLPV